MGGAKKKKPAAAAVDRAAVLAQYRTTSVVTRTQAEPEASASLESSVETDALVTELDSGDVASESGATAQSEWNHDDSLRCSATGPPSFAAGSLESVTTSVVTVLPTTHGSHRMVTRDITTADLQLVRKHGSMEHSRGGRRYRYNGFVYVTDAAGRNCITCWKEALDESDLRDGQQVSHEPCLFIQASDHLTPLALPPARSWWCALSGAPVRSPNGRQSRRSRQRRAPPCA